MTTNPNQHDEDDAPAGDLLVEAGPIEAYLKVRGVPKPNAYYLKRSGWPIGNTSGDGGGKLIASAARDRIEQHERRKRFGANGGSVPGLSDDAIERIVVEIGPERIWRAVDKITQPKLPLVAAE
jgi:hypothetical protein